ncbi:hypothetical protein GOODEAATRI_001565 [Goodea atripinnis]|uniref:Uncharacterized protein n=1 Tax=Goodea atripinnis TaxID=208336 RepID=A0ABV0PAI6_9TELE
MIRSEFRSALRRCPTEEEAGSGTSTQPVGQLQSLIAQRMQRAQELLEEMRLQVTPDKQRLSPPLVPPEEELEVERRRAEAERLLEEAVSSWKEAQEVLQEVKELQSQTLRRQRRRTYEKMTSAAAALQPAATSATAAAEEDDTPASPTSPEDDDESETP